jgi:hypothetical protein
VLTKFRTELGRWLVRYYERLSLQGLRHLYNLKYRGIVNTDRLRYDDRRGRRRKGHRLRYCCTVRERPNLITSRMPSCDMKVEMSEDAVTNTFARATGQRSRAVRTVKVRHLGKERFERFERKIVLGALHPAVFRRLSAVLIRGF